MNADMRYFGCKGGSCPKQKTCARYVEQGSEDRPHTFYSAPFNRYHTGEKLEFRCGYYEKAKEEG